ncbi:mannose-6-phosphate isomerase, class I [Arthrobacter sp. MA-N2]|uniref:mannose-6-phosphate isomerase, class I n=1 Tax=Arthrobacter sp. MA-N2 TaxID=1101188 RepID=UPI000481E42B|nr:mannose-6-phosphate isomerase, class I [Arthrobacter sp. MA-N2]
MYRLTGSRRSYDWGSETSMFEFLGGDPDGAPFAELWLGAHPTGPSMAHTSTGAAGLDKVIESDPITHLGHQVQAEFGRLPYLLKLLAPARPLSMQVHPTPEMAQAGFHEEETRGVPVTDPGRNFKDEYHKPEMVYALTRFEGLVGFRTKDQVHSLLSRLGGPVTAALDAVASAAAEAGLRNGLRQLLQLSTEDLDHVVAACRHLAATSSDPEERRAYGTVDELARVYPGDVGAVVSLLLNRVLLEPGQLVFLGDGIPHAYLSGFGLELMANSDNVLRLGLTSKHLDSNAMIDALDFTSTGYDVESAPNGAVTHVFAPPVPEFSLSISHPERADGPHTLPGDGPRVLICVEGTIQATTDGEPQGLRLNRGESIFVPAADGPLTVKGSGTVAQAFVPRSEK